MLSRYVGEATIKTTSLDIEFVHLNILGLVARGAAVESQTDLRIPSLTIREMALPDDKHRSKTLGLSTHPQAHLASLRTLLRSPFLMVAFVGDPPTLSLPMPQYLLSFPSPLSW